MDIKLKVFIDICNRGSFSAAARDCYLSQSTVTQYVKKMENEYNCQLFIRTRDGIIPTDAGYTVLHYANSVKDAEDTLFTSLNLSGGNHTVRIGANLSIGDFLVPSLFANLEDKFPSLNFKFHVRNTPHLRELWHSQLIDFYIDEIPCQENGAFVECIHSDRYYLICASSSGLCENIKFSDIVNKPWIMRERGNPIRDQLDTAFITHRKIPSICAISSSNQTIINLVKMNAGITLAPKSIVRRELNEGSLCALDIIDAQFPFSVYLMNRRNTISSVKELVSSAIREEIINYFNKE